MRSKILIFLEFLRTGRLLPPFIPPAPRQIGLHGDRRDWRIRAPIAPALSRAALVSRCRPKQGGNTMKRRHLRNVTGLKRGSQGTFHASRAFQRERRTPPGGPPLALPCSVTSKRRVIGRVNFRGCG